MDGHGGAAAHWAEQEEDSKANESEEVTGFQRSYSKRHSCHTSIYEAASRKRYRLACNAAVDLALSKAHFPCKKKKKGGGKRKHKLLKKSLGKPNCINLSSSMWLRPSYFSLICLNTSLKLELYVELRWMNVFASGWVYARIHAVSCGATTTETRNPQILCFKCSDSSRCRKQRDGQIQSSVGNHSNSSDFQVKISCNLQFPFSVCFRLFVDSVLYEHGL